jgi:hypothetical protein
MVQDHIRYDILAQDALRGVIRKVLAEVATTGSLPGDHHFFITFMTNAPGVRISAHLRQKYQEQMTIVVQHQFWDLKVSDTHFEIGLSFSDTPERLVVPFSAVRGFYDPSVNFELEFDAEPGDGVGADFSDEELAEATDTVEELLGNAAEPAEPADKRKEKAADDKAGADVVSLDAFRKKN